MPFFGNKKISITCPPTVTPFNAALVRALIPALSQDMLRCQTRCSFLGLLLQLSGA